MKHFSILLGLFIFIAAFSPNAVSASHPCVGTTDCPPADHGVKSRITPAVTISAPAGRLENVRNENVIERLKEKANKEIERRIKALNHLLELIAKANKVDLAQKASLTAQVQAEITALNALKAKIDAATDVATLRADIQAIKKSYHVFALYIPKIHIMIKAERTLDLSDKTSSLAAKLEERINALPQGSSNSAELRTLLATMKKQIEDGGSQARLALNTVTLLTPEGYPANRTSLMAARKLLRDAHRNLMEAHKTGKKIIKGLRENTVSEASTAPTAASTAAPTTTQ